MDDRQSFLDPELWRARMQARIGVVGLSGGGSHIVQHLAHNGFQNFALYDPKPVEEKHLRRLVGMTRDDVRLGRPKTAIAERMIRGLEPDAQIVATRDLWQRRPDPLKLSDIIFGAVDTFRARRDLEAFARRHHIPLIDVGMAVDAMPGGACRVAGQVILSVPGRPCMWCMGFLRAALLNAEGAEYGDAGVQPQVVNVNAILAGAATWMAIDVLTGKMGASGHPSFLSYDGNRNQLVEHPRWPVVRGVACTHFPDRDVGDFRAMTG